MPRRSPATGRPGDRRTAGGGRGTALGRTDGGATVAGPGPHRPGPPGGQGIRHRAARRPLVRAQSPGAAARRQSQPAAGHGRPRADRRVRALPHALAARNARQPPGGSGRTARSPRAAAGDRGTRSGVGGADPPGPRERVRLPLARRALLVRRNRVGAPDAAGRADGTQRHALAVHAARLRAARRPRRHAACRARRCARRQSPKSARRPTCWRRCGYAGPASARSWRR